MTVAAVLNRGSDFSGLCRQVRDAKLLERRRGNYAARILITLALFAAGWWAFVAVGDSWYQTIVAAVLGILFTQVAFLGHDGGHQQVFRAKRKNDAIGIVAGDLLVGLSYGWWVDKHNRHHSHPNHEDEDPDIGDGVLAFTTNQVAKRTGALGRFIARHQAWLFFPLLTLEGLNLHVASVGALRTERTRRYRRLEIGLFAVHIAVYIGGVLLVLSPVKALVFVAIHQGVFGLYMGCSFAPNHKGMPTFPARSDLDFLRRQVLTSRNVRGGWFTDLLLGGLNYQIEHHLFPNMPRPSLRKAQRLVRAYCQDHQIHYTETGLFGSYAAALRHLHELGAPLRSRHPVAFDVA
ncbi:MAG: fatty acid desaturase [Jatrophihabitantaceae bacterium]